MLGHHGQPLTPEGDPFRESDDRGADHSGIEQLTGAQALRIVATARQDPPAAHGHEVRRRAPDVDEQRRLHSGGDDRRARHPVGRADPRSRGSRPARIHEAVRAGVEAKRSIGQALPQRSDEAGHACVTARKQIHHLSGHCHRVERRLPHDREHALQRRVQMLDPLPQRAGYLQDTLDDTRCVDPRGLHMCAT